MNRVYVVVEGQTEQTFVRDVLAPELAITNIYLYPRLIGKPGHKGGDIRFDRAKDDICNFLKQETNTYITTMFDFYRIDGQWPGRDTINQRIQSGSRLSSIQKARILEEATKERIQEEFSEFNSETRFIPYIEMHEFEALLFSKPSVLAQAIGRDESEINEILEDFDNNPEEINDHSDTAPSKRLEALRSGYRKVVMGKSISESIGIPTIRRECTHFNNWLDKIESLAGDN